MSDQAEKLRLLAGVELNQSRTGFTTRPARRKNMRVIAVTSGKGGVGKTNMVANLALALIHYGKKVMVIDADLSLANIDVLLGITPRFNLAHVLMGHKSLDEVIVTGPGGLRIIPASSGIQEMAHLTEVQKTNLIHGFLDLKEETDVILIDTAAGISWNVISFILAADETIIVTTPEPTAVTDAYAIIKTIYTRNPLAQAGILVNMAANRREAEQTAEKIAAVTRQFLRIDIARLGFITTDPAVRKAIRIQRPFILSAPNTPASRCVKELAFNLCHNTKANQNLSDVEGFLTRMVNLFRQTGDQAGS